MNYIIILPFYRKWNTIDRCLNSIIKASIHSRKEVKILLVNDYLEDNHKVANYVNSYAHINQLDGHKIQLIGVSSTKNLGCSGARLEGVRRFNHTDEFDSNYIVHMDPDDYVDITMFDQLDKATKKFDADVIIGHMTSYYKEVGFLFPYLAYNPTNPKTLNKVIPISYSDIIDCGHPIVTKYATLGRWKKCIKLATMNLNCNEDLYLTTLLYLNSKTCVYTDINYYVYEGGNNEGIMNNVALVGEEPINSQLAHNLAVLLEGMNEHT